MSEARLCQGLIKHYCDNELAWRGLGRVVQALQDCMDYGLVTQAELLTKSCHMLVQQALGMQILHVSRGGALPAPQEPFHHHGLVFGVKR